MCRKLRLCLFSSRHRLIFMMELDTVETFDFCSSAEIDQEVGLLSWSMLKRSNCQLLCK